LRIKKALSDRVWSRARLRCEYCQLHRDESRLPFEIDHILSKQHGGVTTAENLALACFYCNRFKGPNLSSIDPHDETIVVLFNPRTQDWQKHFRWNGPVLSGRTAIGRATIRALKINLEERVQIRRLLNERD